MHSYPAVNELIGAEVYIKHENVQPTGAFKVRGGVNLVSQMSDEDRGRGLIAASTGNHGQSVAYAARLFGARAAIVAPEGSNPGKVAAMRGMGAEVILHGATFDDARLHCERLAEQGGRRYVHSGDEPLLIAGVGTYSLEIVEDAPDVDVIIVAVGGGSGAAGACVVADAVGGIEVIGVQSSESRAGYESWRARRMVESPNRTFADGLATGTAFALPQSILADGLSDFVLVDEEEIRHAMRLMIELAHTLAEAAGAAALAAAYSLRDQLAGRTVALVCSGGNARLEHVRLALGD